MCYESQKLNEHEQNYPTHDLELAVIIHVLKMWRHYLLGRRFTLMSDHSGLRYLFDQSNLNARKLDEKYTEIMHRLQQSTIIGTSVGISVGIGDEEVVSSHNK